MTRERRQRGRLGEAGPVCLLVGDADWDDVWDKGGGAMAEGGKEAEEEARKSWVRPGAAGE